MTESNPPPNSLPPASAFASPKPPRKRKWLRRLLVIGVILVVLLVGVIALLPTILSTGAVRSMALSQVNGFINGRVDAESLSVGWFAPTRLTGVKVYDDKGILVAELDRFESESTLMQLARNPFDLRKTSITGNGTDIRVYPDGTTNLQRLVKSGEKPAREDKPDEDAGPAELPDIAVDLTLDVRAAVSLMNDAGQATTVLQLRKGGGTIKIPNINQPVETNLDFAYDVTPAGKPPSLTGTASVVGNVDAIENNRVLPPEQIVAKLLLTIANNDLAGLEPFLTLAKVGPVRTAGIAGGKLDIDLRPGGTGFVKGQFDVTDLLVAAPQLKDVYTSKTASLPIDLSRQGLAGKSRIVVSVRPSTDDFKASIDGDLPEAGLRNLADKKPAGDTGRLTASVTLNDLGALARKLPNTLKVQEGVTLERGDVVAGLTLDVMPDKLIVGTSTRLAVAGVRDGKPIAIDKTQLTTAATLTSLADTNAILRGTRDLKIAVASPFAVIDIGGPSLATINGGGKIDLNKAREQVAQFFDLGGAQIGGNLDFNLVTHERQTLATTGVATYDVKFDANAPQLKVLMAKMPPIDLTKLGITATAVVDTDGGTAVRGVSDSSLSVSASDAEQKPLVDLALLVPKANLTTKQIEFELKQASVTDLARAQKIAAPFVPAIQTSGFDVANGAFYASGKGQIDLLAMRIDLQSLDGSITSLNLKKGEREVIRRDTFRFNASAVATIGQVKGAVTTVDRPKISLDSDLIKINATSPDRIEVANGLPRGNLSGDVTLNLPAINTAAAAFSTGPVPAVTSGTLGGKFALASVAGKDASLSFDGQIADLSIPDRGVEGEAIALAAAGTVDAAFERFTGNASASAAGKWLSLSAKDVEAVMKTDKTDATKSTPAHQIVRRATITVGLGDLPKAYAVVAALVPGLDAPYVPTSGGLAINGAVDNGTVTLDMKTSALALRNAETKQVYTFDRKAGPSMNMKASLEGTAAVEKLIISELSAGVEGASVTATKPITIDDLNTQPKPNANLRVVGDAERLLALLQFVQGAEKPMPYRGAIGGDVRVAASGGGQTSAGMDLTIDDFAVLNDAGQATLTEKQVALVGDFMLSTSAPSAGGTASTDAKIHKLDLTMPQSKAANLSVRGSVADVGRANKLAGVVLDFAGEGEKLWPMVYAFLSPELQANYAKTRMAGPVVAKFTADGAYPMAAKGAEPMTWNASAKSLDVKGRISAAKFDAYDDLGAQVENFEMYLTLRDGALVTGDMDKKKGDPDRFAKPFAVNSGRGDLGSIVIDVSDPRLPTSIGRGQKLFENVRLNPVMSAQLGSLASAIFSDADSAAGAVTLTAVACNRVPLADLLGATKRANAEFTYSVKDLRLDGDAPKYLAQFLGWGDQGIVGNINNGTLKLVDGVVWQDTPIELLKEGERTNETTGEREKVDLWNELRFKGGIDLSSKRFQDYSMFLSSDLLPKQFRKGNPRGLSVGLQGRATDMKSVLTQALAGVAVQGAAGGVLDDLLGGKKKDRDDERDRRDDRDRNGDRQDEKKRDDPIGGILDDLIGGKKERDKR